MSTDHCEDPLSLEDYIRENVGLTNFTDEQIQYYFDYTLSETEYNDWVHEYNNIYLPTTECKTEYNWLNIVGFSVLGLYVIFKLRK